MKNILSFVTILILNSCLGVIDEKALIQMPSKPEVKELAGKWEADSFSYKLIKGKKVYKEDSLNLFLYENKMFKIFNLPDFVRSRLGSPVKGELYNDSGSWTIENSQNRWRLQLEFKNSPSTEYLLYKRARDSRLVLICFVGDPDSGERLLFLKQ